VYAGSGDSTPTDGILTRVHASRGAVLGEYRPMIDCTIDPQISRGRLHTRDVECTDQAAECIAAVRTLKW
jgi:hypothetical protein